MIKKNLLFLLTFYLLFTQTLVYAHAPLTDKFSNVPGVDDSVFRLDEANLEVAMADLNKLDSYLQQHQDATYQDVFKNNAQLVANVSPIAAPAGGDGPLGIPSFLWGCIFGIIGILLVYLATDNNMNETKKALWGCLVGTSLGIILVEQFASNLFGFVFKGIGNSMF